MVLETETEGSAEGMLRSHDPVLPTWMAGNSKGGKYVETNLLKPCIVSLC